MEEVAQDVITLSALAAKLKPHRNDRPIINDMFEAADDWKNFGCDQLSDENSNLSLRMRQEQELFDELKAFYGNAIDRDADYVKIMECGARLINACKQRKIDPDGWLGIVKVLRRTFGFLTSEFGLEFGPEPVDTFEYTSDRIRVGLNVPNHYESRCWLTRVSDPSRRFELEDLLFMDGVLTSLALPPGREFATEADVQVWFTTVADILRRHGSDVLADRPGAFGRLAQASAERERLHNEECERLWRLANPGKPLPEPGSGL